MAPVSVTETPFASPFRIPARVLIDQTAGSLAEAGKKLPKIKNIKAQSGVFIEYNFRRKEHRDNRQNCRIK
jgi:hypothetical protein